MSEIQPTDASLAVVPATSCGPTLLLSAVLLATIAGGCAPSALPAKAPAATATPRVIRGAGATFPAPLYKKWIEQYQRSHPDVLLSYEAVGSGEGVRRFVAGLVDFGASDAAMTDEELQAVAGGVQLIPATAGAIVLAYNLQGLKNELKLTRDVYTDIFLGRITSWNDRRIAACNPDANLPRATIVIVARGDSSGTTFAFTNHLSAISEEWRDRGPGTGKVVDWPGNAMIAQGNEGVAGRILQSAGSIGYVDCGIAQRARLRMAWLENRAGQFVQPTDASAFATLASCELPGNLRVFFPDPEGDASYPIVTFSWLLLNRRYQDPEVGDKLTEFVTWCLNDGQQFSEPLGYARLAPNVVSASLEALRQIE